MAVSVEVVLDQVITRMPDFLDAEKAAKHTFAVGFRVDGRPDGDSDRVVVYVDQGSCRVERDGEGDRDATIVLGGTQFLKLVLGHLNPVTAVMRGVDQGQGRRRDRTSPPSRHADSGLLTSRSR